MGNQVSLSKRSSTVGFNLYYATTLVLILIIPSLFGAAAVSALAGGSMLLFAINALMFLFCIWSFGGHFISIPMTIYLNEKYRQKRFGELDAAHGKALKLLTRLPLRKTLDMPILTSNLALLRLCQGNYDGAEELFRNAVTFINKEPLVKDSFSAAILINNLGCACLRTGKLVEAEMHAKRALEILKLPRNKAYKIVEALPYSLMGAVHARLEEFDTALENFDQALTIYENEKAPAGMIMASFAQGKTQARLWRAYILAHRGKMKHSELDCDMAFAAIAADPMALNTLAIEVLYLLARTYLDAGLYERAERVLGLAYAQCVESPYHPDGPQVLNCFEKLLLATDRADEIADMRAWLHPVQAQDHLLAPISSSL